MQRRKLQLKRETLRNLSEAEMRRVHGGGTLTCYCSYMCTSPFACDSNGGCGHTVSCSRPGVDPTCGPTEPDGEGESCNGGC